MHVSEYLFVLLSVGVAILGLALVVHALWIFHRERQGKLPQGPQVSLKFFKTEISGTRPLAVFAIGTTLVVVALSHSTRILTEGTNGQFAPSVVPPPKPGEYREVEDVKEPAYEGFHFHKDIRVIDLRSRVKVPVDSKQRRVSPVTWVRYSLLEKLTADHQYLDFEFATTGAGLDPRCLTHKYDLLKVTGSHFHGKVNLPNTWQIRVNVEKETVDIPFLVINEATYWNAFSGEQREWASMTVEQKTDVIAMLILFPEKKPIKMWQLFAYPHGEKERRPFEDEGVAFPSQNHQVFLWKIKNPRVGFTYQLDWTW